MFWHDLLCIIIWFISTLVSTGVVIEIFIIGQLLTPEESWLGKKLNKMSLPNVATSALFIGIMIGWFILHWIMGV